jgi:ADP-heptose:LPS heptosyltransferase
MRPENLFSRLIEALAWRRTRILLPLRRWIVLRGSAGLIRWHWPWPLRKPWQKSRLLLTSHGGGIGDELMCTPIFREIRRRNPGCHITFLSRYPEIFRSNPHLDEVGRFSLGAASSATYLQYNLIVPPPRPLVTLMAECVGLVLAPGRLEPPVIEASPELRARLAQIQEPRIVIQPQASQWTPNKQWPVELWTQLIGRLVEHYDVIEVGTQTMFPRSQLGPRFHSLAGGTTMQDFAWIVSQATVFVGPPSGGMHLANAYDIPSVIILGGYEAPDGYDYPWAARFFTPVECAPCWLTTPCPYELKCLRAIRPEEIFQAVVKAVSGPAPLQTISTV